MTRKVIKETIRKDEIKPRFIFKDYQKNLITFATVFILLLILFSPMTFRGMRPGGVDVIGSKGGSHQRIEYQKETGKTVYWNSPVFSGMPIYHRIGGKVFSLDSLISKFLGKIVYSIIWIYLIGFIGMFFLLKFFKFEYWVAVFGGLAFIFIPHYMSLLNIGHFAKFRPIMYMPFVTFFFLSFLTKKNLLWLLGFIFAFSVQLRTQHYQIVFYQIMLLVFVGLYFLIKMLIAKETKRFFIKIALIIFASFLVTLMIAQPLFVTKEYTPYSIRGGTGEKGSTGLTLDYSTSWSFHPAEMLTWIMPRFFGGTSGEVYNGNKVPRWKGKTIPGYWGQMPFTQTYDYIGAVIVFLALLGLILNFKNNFIKVLLGLFVLSLLLSFGRHFPLIYNLFFQNVPYFNKFRVPAMIQVLMQFIVIIWACFGINSLVEKEEGRTEDGRRRTEDGGLETKKVIIGVLIFLVVLGLIPQIFGSSFSLEKAGESGKYEPQVISLFQTARLDMMQTDGLRLIFFAIITGLLCYLFVNKSIKKYVFLAGLIILLLVDLIPYVKKAEGELYDVEKLEQSHFRKSSADAAILQDTTYYRIFPLTENPFNNNDWSYYHSSIGGYSAAKLRIYQDVIENCLQNNPLNWNVFKMLNVKYLIANTQLPPQNVQPYHYDKQNKLLVYQTTIDSKPAWFVEESKIIPERKDRFAKINSENFDPYKTAILEQELDFQIQSPDSSYVKLENASFNKMKYKIYNDKPALLVISEIYYPPAGGWKCFVDGKRTEIYKTDHILRSVYIDSAGEHEVVFEFNPEAFVKNYRLS
ncbi:MAG: hypothetical protein U9P79_08085, partial [Candidatus Cloacimonadota bacterium]|nr:hypothetical protein [Candidatus Cloacimonadota bacterium]